MLKQLASSLAKKIWKNSSTCSEDMASLIGYLKFLWGMKEFFDKLQASFDSQIEKNQLESFLDLALFTPKKDAVSKQRCLTHDKEPMKETVSAYVSLETVLDVASCVKQESCQR